MLYLQTTKKALTRLGLGRERLGSPGKTDSALGNWLVNLVPMGGREGYLFMSVRSLLSFPIMIGKMEPGPEDMGDFLAHGVRLLTQAMKTPRLQSALLMRNLEEVAICANFDRSLIGLHSAIANDYFQLMDDAGGPQGTDISKVISEVNSRPRKTLDWHNSFEVSTKLLTASVA